MSFINQPSRILISGDDAEWTSNIQFGGQSVNLTLPESVVGAMGVDCARAVIPTTLYNVPDYQNRFYYEIAGNIDYIELTNNRFFSNVADLVTQINADAIAQGKPLVFSYDNITTRITATANGIANFPHIVVDNTNNAIITAGYVQFLSVPLINGVYTPGAFATMVASAFETQIQTVPTFGTATCSGAVVANNLVLTFTNIFGFQGSINPQNPAVSLLLGYISISAIFIQSNNPFTFTPGPLNILPPETFAISSKPYWLTPFALNTRLGFPNTATIGTVSAGVGVAVGTFLPNILRTRIIYLLSNVSVNDSITTDGLRNVLAKIPVTSSYGGFTIYEQKDYNFCRIVQSTLQNLTFSLLDENYQPYNLNYEEPMEIELVFTYQTVMNE